MSGFARQKLLGEVFVISSTKSCRTDPAEQSEERRPWPLRGPAQALATPAAVLSLSVGPACPALEPRCPDPGPAHACSAPAPPKEPPARS